MTAAQCAGYLARRGFLLSRATKDALSFHLPDSALSACIDRKSGQCTLWLDIPHETYNELQHQGSATNCQALEVLIAQALERHISPDATLRIHPSLETGS